MKKFLLLPAMLCAVAGYAGGKSLRVTMFDGRVERYALEASPRVTFDGCVMLIAGDGFSASYVRDDVKSFDFVDKTDAVDDMVLNETVYGYRDNEFTCAGGNIMVFDASGCLVASGVDRVSLDVLPAGLYIVSVNGKSIKIIKR